MESNPPIEGQEEAKDNYESEFDQRMADTYFRDNNPQDDSDPDSEEQLETAANSFAQKAESQDRPKEANKPAGSSKLDNYTIKNIIGEGAFGEVSLAIEREKNRKVAIKAVSIMKICELNKERHILREKELLNELKHPNIIELFTTFKVSWFHSANSANLGRQKLVLCVRNWEQWVSRRFDQNTSREHDGEGDKNHVCAIS